jgi:hypothetical protein
MLQFATEAEQNRAIWTGLPWLPWVVAGRAKPGATVLATSRDESAAAIAAQPYGLGKVLWIGTDGTWRWRHRVGDAYHHRFWDQVVRWAASGKLTAGNPFVRFGPVKPRVAEGDGARLQARISEGVPGIGADLLIAARLYKTDPKSGTATGEAVAVVPFRAVAGQSRTFEGSAPRSRSARTSSGSTCRSFPSRSGSTQRRTRKSPKPRWRSSRATRPSGSS